jgi:hypothetical protein
MTSEDHSPSAVTEFAAEPNYVIVHTPAEMLHWLQRP